MNQNQVLAQQVVRLNEFAKKMLQKLFDPSQQIQLNASVYSEQFGKFFGSANPEARTRFSYHLQKQIQRFLFIFAFEKLKKLTQVVPEPFHFIQQICDIWQNYQRFVYALKFFASSADNTYRTFHKFAGKFDNFLMKQLQADSGDKRFKYQVSPVPVMAANQLRQFLKVEGIFDTLISNFSKIFCAFLKQQREGLNTPRQKINEALQFVQALHLDYECDCVRKSDRYRIVKALSQTAPVNRRSTANAFFIKNFTQKIFEDSEKYYKNWVDTKGINMNASDQLKQIIKFLNQEEGRAKFYIHDAQNQKNYIDIVERNLIEYKMQVRLQKTSGFQYFLANYELDKVQVMEEIENFWKVYKRVYFKPNKSKQMITQIYENYLVQELRAIAKFVDKSAEFIEQTIRLNKKNVQIVSKLLDGLHDFDRIRYQRLEDSLAMKYVNEFKQKDKGKQPMTASKHWAVYIHNKIKIKYNKNQKYNDAVDGDIVHLFKLLVYKTVAVNEYCKYLCQRLLEDVDLSLQAQYSNAYAIQSKIIQEMKAASSQNQVKFISSCLRDLKNSFDLRIKLKQSKNLAAFPFFNQIIRKTGKHWAETPVYDIKTPNVLLKCRDALKQEMQNDKQLFEYFNGASLFTGSINGVLHKFNLKNIYLMILLHIDESPGKKMFFPDIKKAIKPFGSSEVRAMLELVKYLLELCCFGLLKCSKPLTDALCDPDNYGASDYFEINMNFKPEKPLPIYKTINIVLSIKEDLKKKINEKVGSASMDEKNYEKDRRVAVELCTVKVLKHSQTLDGGKGTITFDQILKQQHRQHNVDAKYLKQVVESLINRDVCARVDGKKNTYRYVS